MARAGHRIGVVGATGALGSEVLSVLAGCGLRISEVVPIATDDSLGCDVEFLGDVWPVEADASRLRGVDLLFLCAPPAASLEYAREALRAETACIDCSGALAGSPDVPLRVALSSDGAAEEPFGPLVASPAGPALAWALVLRPLAAAAGLRRVVGSALEGASAGGVRGIAALHEETLALYSQEESPEPSVFGRPVAFDVLPARGEVDESGRSEAEAALASSLLRILPEGLRLAVSVLQVPTFAGQGSQLAIELERPLDPKEARAALAPVSGVEVFEGEPAGATTRAAAGRDVVLVSRLRADPSVEHGLQLWLAADTLRLAARNAVRLAEQRLGAV